MAFLLFVAANFPALLPILYAAYRLPTYISALGPGGWVRFLSRRGCTQGCPAGSLCFAAALQQCLTTVTAEYPDCLIIAIHDDVFV